MKTLYLLGGLLGDLTQQSGLIRRRGLKIGRIQNMGELVKSLAAPAAAPGPASGAILCGRHAFYKTVHLRQGDLL
jgi:hypothetical protein